MSKVLISWTKADLTVSQNCPSNSHIGDIKTDDIVDEICQEPELITSHHDQTDEIASSIFTRSYPFRLPPLSFC